MFLDTFAIRKKMDVLYHTRPLQLVHEAIFFLSVQNLVLAI